MKIFDKYYNRSPEKALMDEELPKQHYPCFKSVFFSFLIQAIVWGLFFMSTIAMSGRVGTVKVCGAGCIVYGPITYLLALLSLGWPVSHIILFIYIGISKKRKSFRKFLWYSRIREKYTWAFTLFQVVLFFITVSIAYIVQYVI
jgi:hypothetical protein